MKERTFYKMQGAGNDYIYFDCLEEPFLQPEKAAVRLSDRHFSVGGDGIVLILPSEIADVKMRMFNADGSEGNMCGNAVRCVGKFLREVKGVRKEELFIETKSGVKTLTVCGKDKKMFRVDMGKPRLGAWKTFDPEREIGVPLEVGNMRYSVTCLSMGNPHCVVFCDDPEQIDLSKVGPLFEYHPAFPERVNTEFVKVMSGSELFMRVWERGSGETLACGTGACAAAVAAVLNGYARRDEEILIHLKGGDLSVLYTEETVYLTGNAELVFTGKIYL